MIDPKPDNKGLVCCYDTWSTSRSTSTPNSKTLPAYPRDHLPLWSFQPLPQDMRQTQARIRTQNPNSSSKSLPTCPSWSCQPLPQDSAGRLPGPALGLVLRAQARQGGQQGEGACWALTAAWVEAPLQQQSTHPFVTLVCTPTHPPSVSLACAPNHHYHGLRVTKNTSPSPPLVTHPVTHSPLVTHPFTHSPLVTHPVTHSPLVSPRCGHHPPFVAPLWTPPTICGRRVGSWARA